MRTDGGAIMKKALCFTGKAISVTAKALLVGVLFIGHLIMNLVGILICAITSQN